MASPTREFWNSQLEVARNEPDYDSWPDRYVALSATAAEVHGAPEKVFEGATGNALWRTTTGDSASAVVFIHGGYWRRFCAADFHFVAAAAADADATFLNVDYRLMPAVRLADVVADTLAAVEAALETADRAVLVGHSAGAHLAVEAALRLARKPAAVVAISGVYDLTPLEHTFIQDELSFTSDELAAHSPLVRARDVTVPVHFAAGALETVEFRRQSAVMHDTLKPEVRGAFALIEGRRHLDVVADLADPKTHLSSLVAAALG